jgi:hypothetical protein
MSREQVLICLSDVSGFTFFNLPSGGHLRDLRIPYKTDSKGAKCRQKSDRQSFISTNLTRCVLFSGGGYTTEGEPTSISVMMGITRLRGCFFGLKQWKHRKYINNPAHILSYSTKNVCLFWIFRSRHTHYHPPLSSSES